MGMGPEEPTAEGRGAIAVERYHRLRRAVQVLVTAARVHLEAWTSHRFSCAALADAWRRARPEAVLGGGHAVPEPEWALCDCRVRELREAIEAVEREDARCGG